MYLEFICLQFRKCIRHEIAWKYTETMDNIELIFTKVFRICKDKYEMDKYDMAKYGVLDLFSF